MFKFNRNKNEKKNESLPKDMVTQNIDDVDEKNSIVHLVCNGSKTNTKSLYSYEGASSCIIAKTLFNGSNLCDYGCLGLGSCAHACPEGAIKMIDGLPQINPRKCTACGLCTDICPQLILLLVPRSQDVFINCNNLANSEVPILGCGVGCIKCSACANVCPVSAITITDIARIDYTKCTNCGDCISVCPNSCLIKQPSLKNIKAPEKDLGSNCGSCSSSCGGCTSC